MTTPATRINGRAGESGRTTRSVNFVADRVDDTPSSGPKANLSGYERCTMLETLAISLSRANMTLRSWGHGEPERLSDFQCETQNEVFSMTETQIEEAERLLSYYECHGAIHNWGADAAALLRDLLPDWSAFKEAIVK